MVLQLGLLLVVVRCTAERSDNHGIMTFIHAMNNFIQIQNDSLTRQKMLVSAYTLVQIQMCDAVKAQNT